jgi:hypothetical protein
MVGKEVRNQKKKQKKERLVGFPLLQFFSVLGLFSTLIRA